MNRLDYIRRQFDYDHWANGRVLDALVEQNLSDNKATDLLVHILTSLEIWCARMSGISTDGRDFFPNLTLEQCRLLLAKNKEKYDELLDEMDEKKLDEAHHYHNSMGEEFSASFATVLSHLLQHGAYHRGQIATLMRQSGAGPVRTDAVLHSFGDS